MKLVNIGFGNYVFGERIVTLLSLDSAPIKRMVGEARETGRLVDASFGRKSRTVIITDSDHVVLSALPTEMIAARMGAQPEQRREEADFEG